jgi:hypothetical protein
MMQSNWVLSHNDLAGYLPTELGQYSLMMASFDISYNHLSGPLPSELGRLSLMTDHFDISENNFCDNLPVAVADLTVTLTTTGNELGTPCCEDPKQQNQPITCSPSLFPTTTPSLTVSPTAPSQLPTVGAHSNQHHANGFSVFHLSEAVSIGVVLGSVVSLCCMLVFAYFIILAYKQRQLLTEFSNEQPKQDSDVSDRIEQRRRRENRDRTVSDREGSSRNRVPANRSERTKPNKTSTSPPQKKREKRRNLKDKDKESRSPLTNSLLAGDEEMG